MPDTREFAGGAAIGRSVEKVLGRNPSVPLGGPVPPPAKPPGDPVAATLMAAAALRGERAQSYGDAAERSALAITALFPKGITLQSPRDQQRFFLLRMVTAKLARYAVKFWDKDDDSLKDSINYLAMLAALDKGDDLGDMPF